MACAGRPRSPIGSSLTTTTSGIGRRGSSFAPSRSHSRRSCAFRRPVCDDAADLGDAAERSHAQTPGEACAPACARDRRTAAPGQLVLRVLRRGSGRRRCADAGDACLYRYGQDSARGALGRRSSSRRTVSGRRFRAQVQTVSRNAEKFLAVREEVVEISRSQICSSVPMRTSSPTNASRAYSRGPLPPARPI